MTKTKEIEELKTKVRQLESITAISGGIAHDYNNLLTAIMGNISLAMGRLDPDTKTHALLNEALAASRIAKALTLRLMTFSMGDAPDKKSVSVFPLINNVTEFSLSGSNIRCCFDTGENLWPVLINSSQMGHAIHNIVINAAESMPNGGTLHILAENVTLHSAEPSLKKGNYVKISFKDQGNGIPEEHIDKVFTPYFSTKGKKDERMGLGLSISDSIVGRHGGKIKVSSIISKGSRFDIFLPASDQPAEDVLLPPEPTNRSQKDTHLKGSGKILLMDDEEMVRDIAGNILNHLGYDVEFAVNGMEAISKYKAAFSTSAPFDAVILDLTIRGGMGGSETIEQLLHIDPEIRAIVSSGYIKNPVMKNHLKYGFMDAIVKPYEIEEIRDKLSAILSP